MNDSISRQTAINTVNEMRNACDTESLDDYRDLLVECFEVMPPAQPEHNPDDERKIADLHRMMNYLLSQQEQRWIPCSEKLPEDEKKNYWVCTDTGCQCECRWTNINHIWTDLTTNWHWHIMDIPRYSAVIAWMPLPAPYREEGEAE